MASHGRRSHGALSLIRLPLPIVPPRPPSPSTSPGPLSSHQGRPQQMSHGGWSHSSSKKNPGSTNRIAGRALCGRCRLGVPLPANCRLVWARSAARLSSRRRITSVGGPLPGAGRGDDEHEAKRRRCADFLPEHDGGWWVSVHRHHHRGRDEVKISRVVSCVPSSGEICGRARGGIRKNDYIGRRTGFCVMEMG